MKEKSKIFTLIDFNSILKLPAQLDCLIDELATNLTATGSRRYLGTYWRMKLLVSMKIMQ
jgi:hypothetical protein